MLSLPRALFAALALLAVSAAPAAARLSAQTLKVLDLPLTSAEVTKRTCSAAPLAPGSPGAVVRRIAAPMGGMIDARLHGTPHGADWDLAIFDTLNGRLLNGSAAFGGNEVVQSTVTSGQLLTIQACRHAGGALPIQLTVNLITLSGTAPKARAQSLVSIPSRTVERVTRLHDMGMDLNEGVNGDSVDAVLHGPADAAKLRKAGFDFTVKIPDLAAYDRKHVRTSFDPIGDILPSGLPSGRRTYRHLVDYENDLKALVDGNPGLVRPVILPLKSVEGRTIEGVEIAKDVSRTDDGRPTHVEMGLHHVREWPSGEVTMEFGFTMVKGKDTPRIAALLADVRTFVLPVINPDGLEASMMAGDSIPVYDDNGVTSLPLAVIGAGAYRRKNCQPTQAGTEALPCAFKDGIDLNRNYGAFWGGPGSGAAPGPTGQTYRGPKPFSEPESEAVHQWSSRNHVMVINSNHTYAGDFLFQPGFGRDEEPGLPYKPSSKPIGQQVPYQAQMKALSDAMATAAGYKSIVSYDLYDVTGATEDWNYFAQGAFGYTAEVAWEDFHPNYQDGVIDQYLGTVDGVLGKAAERAPSKGLQESFLLAGEAAVNTAYHSVIEGDAPAGARLKVTKDFTTATSYDAQRKFQQVPEHLETTLTVPASGHYVWHVNPSTRPIPLIAKKTEAWTLTCGSETVEVVVAIGQRVTQNLTC